MSIGDITNKAKQTTPKHFFGIVGIIFLLWIICSMLFCNGSCTKDTAKTCKKSKIGQGFDATKQAGKDAVGIVKGAGEGAVGIVKGAGNAVEKAAQSTRQSIFGRTAAVETTETEPAQVAATTEKVEVEKTTEAPVKTTTSEESIIATSNPIAAPKQAVATPTIESKQVVTEEIIKKKIIVEVEFQTPDGKVLGSKDVAVDEAETAAATETVVEKEEIVVETKAVEPATPAKTDNPIDTKIEQLQKEIEKLNAAKALLEDLK
ncbi:MAG: hypothetical protein ACPG5B_08205 [Chitinophagales bacterium]